jgi:hypothetical protein
MSVRARNRRMITTDSSGLALQHSGGTGSPGHGQRRSEAEARPWCICAPTEANTAVTGEKSWPAAILIVAPAFVFFLLTQRQFVEGMVRGSVKG